MDMETLEAIGRLMDKKLKEELAPIKEEIKALRELKKDMDWMRGAMVRIEQNHLTKIDVAVSGIDDHNKTLRHHNRRITALESDIERHDMEIAAPRQA